MRKVWHKSNLLNYFSFHSPSANPIRPQCYIYLSRIYHFISTMKLTAFSGICPSSCSPRISLRAFGQNNFIFFFPGCYDVFSGYCVLLQKHFYSNLRCFVAERIFCHLCAGREKITNIRCDLLAEQRTNYDNGKNLVKNI